MADYKLVESKAFEEILDKVETIAYKADTLYRRNDDKYLREWLDGQDVCTILNISPRTLQTYRDTGKIGFCQINHKIYYKSNEVNKLLKRNYLNNNNKKK